MKELSTQIFDEALQLSEYVLVDFWAPWCGPCKKLAPVLEEVEPEYEGKLSFVKMDIDKNQDTAMKYGVFSIPNVCIFKNGALLDRITGFKSKKDLIKFIDKQLKK